ncbi:hypothetical protein AB4391_02640 [Vibrio lentus]|uniref:Uncharacterized protein n=1 Tax=Vibrio lentus TaxID=136468 RepID=A0A2N7K218_9VIBR|nr:hypothetical protein [Vibrio lentus]PMM67718.1 hypothetical protein BCT49_00370 [Vibrio lentus]
MNQNKCVFCYRGDVELILLGSGRSCSNCLVIAHDLVHIEGFSPENKVEEAVLSLIFFLETDLVLTRELLKSQSLSGDIQTVIGQKKEKLAAIEVSYSGVEESYTKKIKDLLNEHTVLLGLYADLP